MYNQIPDTEVTYLFHTGSHIRIFWGKGHKIVVIILKNLVKLEKIN